MMGGARRRPRVAFVLGGGGPLGAYEVGMLLALAERDIRPDLVVGASIGAINGAGIAYQPTVEGVEALRAVWLGVDGAEMFGGGLFASALTAFRNRTHLYSARPLRELLEQYLPATFGDLEVPFQCVAASIERSSEHWFDSGPLIEAVLASSAVPGLFPPVEVDGEHFVDGGIVNSIPVSRAVALGAERIFILQVGKVERPLEVPRRPWEVALVAMEIARRYRFSSDLASLPEGVAAHLLPSGATEKSWEAPARRYADLSRVAERIELAHQATGTYLDGL